MMTDARQGDGERLGWWRWMTSCAGMMTETDRKNSNRFTGWTFAWAVSFVGATLVLKAGLVPEGAASWAVALAPDVLGLAALLAYVRFLRQTDELMRKIQLEGLAVGFGVGVVFAMGYRLLERAGAPDLDINDVVLVMLLAWVVGQLVALRRYR
jgi:hypothetical protein